MIINIASIKIGMDSESHKVGSLQELDHLRSRGSRDYAEGLVDMYKKLNPPSRIKSFFGLERVFEDPLYSAAVTFLEETK